MLNLICCYILRQAPEHDTSVYILAVDLFIAIDSLRFFLIYWNFFKTVFDELNQKGDLLITDLPPHLKTGLVVDFSSDFVNFSVVDLSHKFYFRTLGRVIHKFKVYSVLFPLYGVL